VLYSYLWYQGYEKTSSTIGRLNHLEVIGMTELESMWDKLPRGHVGGALEPISSEQP